MSVGQELQTILIVVLVIVSPSVVQAESVEQAGEHFSVSIREEFYFRVYLLQNVQAVEMEAQIELFLSLRNPVNEKRISLSRIAFSCLIQKLDSVLNIYTKIG